MKFWEKSNQTETQDPNAEKRALIASLEQQNEELVNAHAGTERWISEDTFLLNQRMERIAALKAELGEAEEPEELKKAA